jgi:PIN domain nuclease of toxin-antitoxin system
MRLLLDTHIALWAIADHPNLSGKARRLIDDPGNQIVVSTASVWEIAIKHALARGGPNSMPISGQEALGYFRDAGFEVLDIIPAHVTMLESLPS